MMMIKIMISCGAKEILKRTRVDVLLFSKLQTGVNTEAVVYEVVV